MGTALITGASSGLGREFAWQLARQGHRVILVARNTARLENLAAQIDTEFGTETEILPADLGTAGGREKILERLRDTQLPVGLLVNNAGLGSTQAFLESDIAAETEALEVMVAAVLELSHTAGQAMARRGRGAIINVASVAAFMPGGTYSAHKAWVDQFSQAQAAELRPHGVRVLSVCPGLIRTDFHRRAGMDVTWLPRWAWIPAEQVVAAALAAVGEPLPLKTPARIVPSWRYYLATLALRWLPRPALRSLSTSRFAPRERKNA